MLLKTFLFFSILISSLNGKDININEAEGKAIQLIRQDQDGKFLVSFEALDILKSLKGNVAVVNIVGPYRSGKSLLLNLFLNQKDGFKLGNTYESCTRGIWMWNKPIKHKNKNGEFYLILMDTEGLASPDSDSENDNKIFVLSLLMSSAFLYNTKGVIDRDSIKKLGVMNHLAKYIENNSQDFTNKDIEKYYLPDFIWVTRDFQFPLDGKTAKEYLEERLQVENSRNNEEIIGTNFIRQLIKNSFKSLDCFCLPIPIESGIDGLGHEETLCNLDKIDFDKLKLKFQTEVKKLFDSIKEKIAPKLVDSIPLSAQAFSNYIDLVVKTLNENLRVSIIEGMSSSLKYAFNLELENAIVEYKTKMDTEIEMTNTKILIPLTWPRLYEKNEKVIENIYQNLKLHLNGENGVSKPILEKFNKTISQYEVIDGSKKLVGGLYHEYCKDHSIKVKSYYKNELKMNWEKLKKEMELEKIDTKLSKRFKEALDNFKENYDKNLVLISPEKAEIFQEWYSDNDIDGLKRKNEATSQKLNDYENEKFWSKFSNKFWYIITAVTGIIILKLLLKIF